MSDKKVGVCRKNVGHFASDRRDDVARILKRAGRDLRKLVKRNAADRTGTDDVIDELINGFGEVARFMKGKKGDTGWK